MSTVTDPALRAYVATSSAVAAWARRRHRDQRGEGVISAAIAVLIMAFIGAGMWLAFDRMFTNTADRTEQQVEMIGG